MSPNDQLQPSSMNEYLAPMERYKAAVLRRFPALPQRLVDDWFINPTNALILGHFLQHYPRGVVALDIGTFVGASAFCFASHPKVSRVISVDPNPLISDELTVHAEERVREADLELLEDFRVFDVARAVLADFEEERAKIELREGVVGSTTVGAKGRTIPGLEKVEVPVVEPADGRGLVALVDGLHTREGVRADLAAVFEKNPHAVALMDDCRNRWGPFVQAGVVDFTEGAEQTYHFRVFGDLAPGLMRSSFGIVYPEPVAAETEGTLYRIRETFQSWPEPAHLLRREEKLTRELERAKKKAARFESRAARLEKQRDELNARYSSRRYQVADAIAERALRLPGSRKLLGHNAR